MSAVGLVCKRGGPLFGSSQSRSALASASFATRTIAALIPDSSSSSSPLLYSNRRGQVLHISQLVKSNGKRASLVDTLALVRRLEAQGVLTKHAEAITSAITDVLKDSSENAAQSFASKGEMQKSETIQDANLSMFMSQVQSSQEHHFSLLQREKEKLQLDIERESEKLRGESEKLLGDIVRESEKLRGDIQKMRSELRYEIANATAASMDKLEATKYVVMKYVVGTVVLVSPIVVLGIRVLIF